MSAPSQPEHFIHARQTNPAESRGLALARGVLSGSTPMARLLSFGAAALFSSGLAGCSGDAGNGGSSEPRITFGGSRPVDLAIPAAYDAEQSWPLLMVLHGYSVNAAIQTGYFGVNPLVDSEGILLIAPEGLENSVGDQFWNATDACCGFGEGTDDVTYLRSLIEDVSSDYTVDPSRVFVIGHSNGGFMTHRMACDASDLVTAAVSLAGMTWLDPADCAPSNDVSFLQIHGTIDDTILYDGGAVDPALPSYPSAAESVARWQSHDACTPGLVLDPVRKDLDIGLAGDETRVERFDCPGSLDVELWTIEGGEHIPDFSDFAGNVWPWLDAHAR